jgi:hypothetical protein
MFRVPLWTGALSALFFVVTGIQFWVTKYLVDVIGVEQGPVCGAGCTSPSSLCHSVLSTHPLFQHVERDARHPPPPVILYCQHTPSFNMWSGMHVTLLPLSFCTVNTPPLSTRVAPHPVCPFLPTHPITHPI